MAIRISNPHLTRTPDMADLETKEVSSSDDYRKLQEPNTSLGLEMKVPSKSKKTRTNASPLFLSASRSSATPHDSFTNIAMALRGVTSHDAKALTRAFTKLGYHEESKANFVRGDDNLVIEGFMLGNNKGHEITFTRGKKSVRGVSFADVVITEKLWKGMSDRFSEEIKRFKKARKKNPDLPLPTNLDALKAYTKLGLGKKSRRIDERRTKEVSGKLHALANKLQSLKSSDQAPKGIIIYVAGPDAAGKSSTGAIVMGAIQEAGYDTRRESFKAPTESERNQHWLKRFERGVPKAGEGVFWDRGPAGDSVYGSADAQKTSLMGTEFNGFEAKLRDDGILMLKIELYANREKQAETFGKRLGRQFGAQTIEKELADAGKLTQENKVTLDIIANKVDDDDFRAFVEYETIQSKFMSFANKTESASPWLVTDASKRHDARLKLIGDFENALEQFVSA